MSQAVQDFNAAVRARMPQHRQGTFAERQAAIAAVARTQPALYRNYIEATNQSTRAQRLIREKFETSEQQ